MAKHHKKPQSVDAEQVVDEVKLNVSSSESVEPPPPQGGELSADSMKSQASVSTKSHSAAHSVHTQSTLNRKTEGQSTVLNDANNRSSENIMPEKVSGKNAGVSKLAVLALLVAFAVGATGHFFGSKKFAEVEQRLATLQAQQEKTSSVAPMASHEIPNFEAEKAQLVKLEKANVQVVEQTERLATQQTQLAKAVMGQLEDLAAQLQQLGSVPKADTSVLLLSDADFLLTNALRKMVIDNDIDTAKSLLLEADNALSQVNDVQIDDIREALKADLNLLNSLNQVDQNNLMQRLAQLANLVDDMPMLENEQFSVTDDGEVSDSLADWQRNIEKSANSFLNRFIRVSDRNKVQDKAFIAPNQEIYLRENIRLRLQIAILTVPRQQNELYKQSLDAVGTWVRSYFDVKNDSVKRFLAEVDDLIEQSVYIDAPTRLQSLAQLKQKLNRRLQPVEKIQLEADKATEALKIEKMSSSDAAQSPQAENATEQP